LTERGEAHHNEVVSKNCDARHLLRAILWGEATVQVQNEMTVKVVCLAPTARLQEAAHLMKELSCRHIPITEDGKGQGRLLGILSDRDVFLHTRMDGDHAVVDDLPVSDVMSTHLIVCHPEQHIRDVARLMLERKVDSLPVVNEDQSLVGLITTSDILALVAGSTHFSSGVGESIIFSVNSLADFDF
jgi:CBS domain-containing protein